MLLLIAAHRKGMLTRTRGQAWSKRHLRQRRQIHRRKLFPKIFQLWLLNDLREPADSQPVLCLQHIQYTHFSNSSSRTHAHTDFVLRTRHGRFLCDLITRCEVVLLGTAKCPRKGTWVLTRLMFLYSSDLAWSVIPVHSCWQSLSFTHLNRLVCTLFTRTL